ncbi:hypothetical protein HYFRA_00001730 [Hymenoscyphus fraxineus]|uniref:Uncharacterized protein n=1 Tax=Hymenoscyphus fraxineus TaxID=746836 RepID=A0A9N9L962_9HELO|nr:hypothetical protein HYFRA_00001730 [Hymenoscyphus fraxineus]
MSPKNITSRAERYDQDERRCCRVHEEGQLYLIQIARQTVVGRTVPLLLPPKVPTVVGLQEPNEGNDALHPSPLTGNRYKLSSTWKQDGKDAQVVERKRSKKGNEDPKVPTVLLLSSCPFGREVAGTKYIDGDASLFLLQARMTVDDNRLDWGNMETGPTVNGLFQKMKGSFLLITLGPGQIPMRTFRPSDLDGQGQTLRN